MNSPNQNDDFCSEYDYYRNDYRNNHNEDFCNRSKSMNADHFEIMKFPLIFIFTKDQRI